MSMGQIFTGDIFSVSGFTWLQKIGGMGSRGECCLGFVHQLSDHIRRVRVTFPGVWGPLFTIQRPGPLYIPLKIRATNKKRQKTFIYQAGFNVAQYKLYDTKRSALIYKAFSNPGPCRSKNYTTKLDTLSKPSHSKSRAKT